MVVLSPYFPSYLAVARDSLVPAQNRAQRRQQVRQRLALPGRGVQQRVFSRELLREVVPLHLRQFFYARPPQLPAQHRVQPVRERWCGSPPPRGQSQQHLQHGASRLYVLLVSFSFS